jgi:serine phosphatase RsbU (regulator of sigma subunit)
VERIWHSARVLVGAASIRSQGRQRISTEHVTQLLGRSGERFAATLSLPLLKKALVEELPGLQVRRAAVSLYCGRFSKELKPFLLMLDGEERAVAADPFPETRVAPEEALAGPTCQHSVVVPLTFEAEQLGVAVFDAGPLPSVFESLRQQIGSAIKGALLHRQMVAQVAMRERLEQERLTEEARLAAEIQTSMSPSCLDVAGLEIAPIMICAAEAGGDYFDVLPNSSGAWLAVGDVTGHGLAAGLVMLMIQSMIAGLARAEPELSPSQIITLVNEAVYDNVRYRLKRDDHATLTVFRYFPDGLVRFSGAHEEIIIWRSRAGRCETISPPGFWVGAIPNVRRMTSDAELRLEKGDLMVLYSDGVTEPRNAQHEQFGLERLVAAVEAAAHRPVDAIRDQIVDAVKGWSSSLDDDVTLLVARYTGSPA